MVYHRTFILGRAYQTILSNFGFNISKYLEPKELEMIGKKYKR